MSVQEKVLVELLQVKNVLKTILHSFQIRGSEAPNEKNEYEHERDSSSNVRTKSSHMQNRHTKELPQLQGNIQNLSHQQNGAPKIEIFWYIMQCQMENSCQCFK